MKNTDWKSRLVKSDGETFDPILLNACIALEHAPELAGKIAGGSPDTCPSVAGELPWPRPPIKPWLPSDDIELAVWLQANGILVCKRIAADAARWAGIRTQVANENGGGE